MATKKKIARSTKGTKRAKASAQNKAVEAKLRRVVEAATNAGLELKTEPFGAELLERAKKVGVPPAELARQDREREETRLIRNRVGGHLVQACDQLGEELARYEDGNGGDSSNVRAALHTLWELRWDLGLYPTTELDDEAEGERAAGGAP